MALSSWADSVLGPESPTAGPAPAARGPAPAPAPGAAGVTAGMEKLTVKDEHVSDEAALEDLRKYGLNFAEAEGLVEVEQADPSSPLHADVKSFEELRLPEEIMRGIYAMGFKKPSKIQEKAIPLILADPAQNLIAQSQSGTGKTAAFVLGMLARIDPADRRCQALVLAPARELALQIKDNVDRMAQFCGGIERELVVPTDKDKRKERHRVTGHLVVATPGTVLGLLEKRLFDVSGIRVFVLDEADQMLDTQGMGKDCIKIKKALPPNVQVLLFSATFSEEVWAFAGTVAPNSNKLRLKNEEVSLKGIKQFWVNCSSVDKYIVLTELYLAMNVGQMIVFCQTRAQANDLFQKLTKDGHKVSVLSGELSPDDRDNVMKDFRDAKTKVLISTNVIARGIDVLTVTLVINWELPLGAPPENRVEPETYLHRIGRTGRFGRKGVAINLIDNERAHRNMTIIENHFQRRCIELRPEDLENLKQVVDNTPDPDAADALGGDPGKAPAPLYLGSA